MPVINTNILSIATQNNLLKSNNNLSTAIARLASGLRINSAKDDAAGQAIANRFTASIKGFNRAKLNASDGISLVQTTEAAVGSVNDNVQRIRELSVQAANGSNSQNDLNSIQDEIRQRLNEIDRVAEQTQFNGKKILNTNNTLKLQTGINDNETVSVNTKNMDTSSLGLQYFNVNGLEQVFPINDNDAQKLTGQSGISSSSLSVDIASAQSTIDKFSQANNLSSMALQSDYQIYTDGEGNYFMKIDTFPTGNDLNTFSKLRMPTATDPITSFFAPIDTKSFDGIGSFKADKFNISNLLPGHVSIEQLFLGPNAPQNVLKYTDIYGAIPYSNNSTIIGNTLTQFIKNKYNIPIPNEQTIKISNLPPPTINQNTMIAHFPAGTFDTSNLQNYNIFTDGQHLFVDIRTTSNPVPANLLDQFNLTTNQGVLLDLTDSIVDTSFILNPDGTIGVDLTTGNILDNLPQTALYTVYSDATPRGVENNFPDPDTARLGAIGKNAKTENPLLTLDKSITTIDSFRGELGAVNNRLESTIANLSTASINLQAARSRIEDTDYAIEVSNMSKNQILQQAGTSVLTQANQVPEIVLQLLK